MATTRGERSKEPKQEDPSTARKRRQNREDLTIHQSTLKTSSQPDILVINEETEEG